MGFDNFLSHFKDTDSYLDKCSLLSAVWTKIIFRDELNRGSFHAYKTFSSFLFLLLNNRTTPISWATENGVRVAVNNTELNQDTVISS